MSKLTKTQAKVPTRGAVPPPPTYFPTRPFGTEVKLMSFQTPPKPQTVRETFKRIAAQKPSTLDRRGAASVRKQPTVASLLPRLPIKIGKESHTLYYEEHNGKFDIMLATNPKLLSSILTTISANQGGNALEQLKYYVDLFDQAASGWKNEFGKALSHHLAQIQGVLPVGIPELAPRPQTLVNWGRTVTVDKIKRGRWMEARLSLNPPSGSHGQQPSGNPYPPHIQGHLLNHHLYGPATPENLIPMTGTMNSKFSANIEEKVKQAVFMENRVLWYKVSTPVNENGVALSLPRLIPTQITVNVKELDPSSGLELTGGWRAVYTFKQNGTFTQTSESNAPIVSQQNNRPVLQTVFDNLQDEKDRLDTMPPTPSPRLTNITTALSTKTSNPTWQAANLASRARDEWTIEHAEYLAHLLQQIQSCLPAAYSLDQSTTSPLGIPTAHKPTVVHYGTKIHFHDEQYGALECGSGMVANPLTMNPGSERGTEPEQKSPYGAGYVQGHLLNHHLHGRGQPKNLVPMSGSVNTKFEKDFEAIVKDAVLGRGEEVKFKAEVKEYSTNHNLPVKLTKDDYMHNKTVPDYPFRLYEEDDFSTDTEDDFSTDGPSAALPTKIKWTFEGPTSKKTESYVVLKRGRDEGDSDYEEDEQPKKKKK